MEDFRTVREISTGEVEEKRSRFLSVLAPVKTEEEARELLESIRRQHHAARHHVFAWILREGGERCSDDGEPAQTAGMPTLEVLRHAELTDVMLITTRYFGGTLLGTGGLQRAYTAAAKAALEAAEPVTYTTCVRLTARVSYAMEQKLRYLGEQAGAKEEPAVYDNEVTLSFLLPKSQAAPLEEALQEALRGERFACSEPFHTLF